MEATAKESASVTIPECVVCEDIGCEYCRAVPEPWPAETFVNLGTCDLEQLIDGACRELAQRIRNATGPDVDQRSHSVGAS